MDAFRGFKHDDLAGGFGASHIFDCQVINADAAQPANAERGAFLYQCGCAFNYNGVVGTRFSSVYNDGVRAGEVLQMEPHGVLRCLFNESVIVVLVCAHLNGVVAVENLGVHLAFVVYVYNV